MSRRTLIAFAIAMSACLPDENLGAYARGTPPTPDIGALGMPPEPVDDGAAPVAETPADAAPVANDDAEGSPAAMALDLGAASTSGTAATAPPNDGDAPAAEAEPNDTEPGNSPEPDPAAEPEAVAPMTEPTGVRFVRLVADSAFQSPYTSVAELTVLDGSGLPIDRSGWTASADSEELVYVGGAHADFAIDGDSVTLWHTAWFQVTPTPHPHRLDVDLGSPHEVSGFRYLGRQDSSLDGRVANYRFFVSVDGVEWGEPVASGTFENTTAEQEVRFAR